MKKASHGAPQTHLTHSTQEPNFFIGAKEMLPAQKPENSKGQGTQSEHYTKSRWR
jgi:hypothetical protein